jgi:hypothetical protein
MGRLEDGELTQFKIAIMARASQSDYLGTIDLGLLYDVGCINRARIKVVGGATYADIKALMSQIDRVIDLDVTPDDLRELNLGEIARLRNVPERGGKGDDTGLLLLYPVSKDSRPVRGSAATREELRAVEHVLGVGIVFPESQSHTAKVDYVTANVAALTQDVEVPDEADEPEDTEVEVA